MDDGHQIDNKLSHDVTAALLSVAASGNSEHLLNTFSIPLILIQIRILQKSGITNFYVEVEQVSKSLVAIADDLRGEDLELKFVRTAAELNDAGAEYEKICIVADGIYADSDFLGSYIQGDKAVILTLENSDMRQGFERIDLESQWGGLAIVDQGILAELGDLPDGWSLPSAILRQAIKAQTLAQRLTEKEIEAASLQHIGDQAAADRLAKSMLSDVSSRESGLIEQQLFLPAAEWVGKWRSGLFPAAPQVAFGTAVIASLLSYFAPLTAAGVVAFISLLFVFFDRLWSEFNLRKKQHFLTSGAVLLLATALVIAGWRSSDTDGVFTALIAAGLAFGLHLSFRVPDKNLKFPSYLAPSSGLMSLLVAVAALTTYILQILQLFALTQIAVLLYVLSGMLNNGRKWR